MIIGVPKEIKEQEQRVALLPSAANQLIRHGHSVVVEKNAGVGPGIRTKNTLKPAPKFSIKRKRFSRVPA